MQGPVAEAPPPELPPGLLVLGLWELLVGFEARLAHDVAGIGLTLSSFRMVGEVMAAPDGVRQSELARRLRVRAPTVSAAVDRLQQQGVLVRAPDPDDPRAHRIRLAPGAPLGGGIALLEQLEASLFTDLSPAERRQAALLFARLYARLAPHRESGP